MSKELSENFADLKQNHKLAYYNYWLKNDTTETPEGKKCYSVGYDIVWFKICKGNFMAKEFTDIPLVGYAQYCIYDDDDLYCEKRDQNIKLINSLIPYNGTYQILDTDIPGYDGIPITLYNLNLSINLTLVNSWLRSKVDDIGFNLTVTYPNAKLLKYEYYLKNQDIDIMNKFNIKNYEITQKDASSVQKYDESSQIGFRKTFIFDKNIYIDAIPKLVGVYKTSSNEKTLLDVVKTLGVAMDDIRVISPQPIDYNNIPEGTDIPFEFDLLPAISITQALTTDYGNVTTVNNISLMLKTLSKSNILPIEAETETNTDTKHSNMKIYIVILIILVLLFAIYLLRKSRK